jgi:hypothetical protein
MKAVWILTTPCVMAAFLLQIASSSNLQNPCILQEIEGTPSMKDSDLEEISIFVCELQWEDCELVEGGVSGSELTVEIKPEDVEILLAQMENTKLDGVTIFAQGLAVDADNKLSFPQAAVVEFGTEAFSAAETHSGGRRLDDYSGNHSVLVVRVAASNTGVKYSADVLSDKVFGTQDDPINLSERFRSCSYGKLQMEPTNNPLATDGLVDITVDVHITPGVTTSESVVNKVKMQLGALVGGSDVSIKDTFRHVIMCLPTGTVLNENLHW